MGDRFREPGLDMCQGGALGGRPFASELVEEMEGDGGVAGLGQALAGGSKAEVEPFGHRGAEGGPEQADQCARVFEGEAGFVDGLGEEFLALCEGGGLLGGAGEGGRDAEDATVNGFALPELEPGLVLAIHGRGGRWGIPGLGWRSVDSWKSGKILADAPEEGCYEAVTIVSSWCRGIDLAGMESRAHDGGGAWASGMG